MIKNILLVICVALFIINVYLISIIQRSPSHIEPTTIPICQSSSNSHIINSHTNSQNKTSHTTNSHDKTSHIPKRSILLSKNNVSSIDSIDIILAAISEENIKKAINTILNVLKFTKNVIHFGCPFNDACKATREEFKSNKRVNVHVFESGTSLGKMWNGIIKNTKNEIFLIISPNIQFEKNTNLEFIRKGFLNTNATIISGSLRNTKNGEVTMPCFRQTLKRWTLKIEYGYEYSIVFGNEAPCVVCGSTALPLAGRRETFLKVGGFDETLSNGVLTEFFVRMKKHNLGVMNCPHSMFSIEPNDEDDEKKIERLMPLVKKLLVDNIIEENGKRLWFCREDWTLAIHHNYWMGGGLYTPMCNYKQYHEFAKSVLKILDDFGIKYKLGGGDALGLIKFRKFLPWDADFDIYMDTTYSFFAQKIIPIFQQRNYQIDIINSQHINIKPTKWGEKVKGLGNDVLISLFIQPFSHPLSKMKLDNVLVNVEYNPFEFSLKTYGNTYFEHHFHSSFADSKSKRLYCKKEWHGIWFDYGGYGRSPPPPKVNQEGHPGCLPDFRETGGGTFLE